MILEGETVLPDDYPVCWGYCYVAVGGEYPDDGMVVVHSGDPGTVADLKRNIGADEIRRCEIVAREKIGGWPRRNDAE